MMEQNQSEIQALYYSTMQSISQSITSAQSNVDNVQAQIDALNTGANDYYLYAPTSGVIHMDSPYRWPPLPARTMTWRSWPWSP